MVQGYITLGMQTQQNSLSISEDDADMTYTLGNNINLLFRVQKHVPVLLSSLIRDFSECIFY